MGKFKSMKCNCCIITSSNSQIGSDDEILFFLFFFLEKIYQYARHLIWSLSILNAITSERKKGENFQQLAITN